MVFLTYRWLGGLYSALDTAVVNLTTARRNILKIGDPAWKREFNGENDHQPVDLGEFRVYLDLKTAGMRSSLYNINIIHNNTAQYNMSTSYGFAWAPSKPSHLAKQCWRMLARSDPVDEPPSRRWGHLASIKLIKLDGRYHKTSESKSHSIIATCCQSQYLSLVENPILGEIICCKSQHPASHHPHGQTVFLVAAIFLMPTKSGMTSNYWTIYHI